MLKAFYFIYLIPLSLSTIFSLRSFRLNWPVRYRYFSLFLIFTLFVEIFAMCWKYFLHNSYFGNYSNSNIWIYNLYLIPEYLFYFFFFYGFLKHQIIKRIFIGVVIIYFLFAVTNLIWIQTFSNLNSFTIIPGNILVVLLSLSYFHQSLNDKEFIKQTSQPLFWIAVAVFIFFSGSLPYFIFMNSLIINNIPMAIALFNILLILNTFMYSLYLIAYLCKPHFQK